MDLTPHDLRNAELREAFRGYRPDEVEELLERAAVALERMHERNRHLNEQLGQAEQSSTEGREIEGVMRQTLLLAQRTADEAVTTAHERARQLVEEAEDRALALVSEAEEQARKEGHTARVKYEAIVTELSARRDVLMADVEALERTQAEYRARLRGVLERELEALDRAPVLPPLSRPDLHEIDLSVNDARPIDAPAKPPASEFSKPEGSAQPSPSAVSLVERSQATSRAPAESESGEATEAMLVLNDEPSGNGRPGPTRRLR